MQGESKSTDSSPFMKQQQQQQEREKEEKGLMMKKKKKLPSPKEMVSHYESKGMDSQEASLKVIDDLQNLLLKVVVINNNNNKKKKLDDEVALLKRLESKLDSKPGYPQSIAIAFFSGGIASSLANHFFNISSLSSSSSSSL